MKATPQVTSLLSTETTGWNMYLSVRKRTKCETITLSTTLFSGILTVEQHLCGVDMLQLVRVSYLQRTKAFQASDICPTPSPSISIGHELSL